MANRALRLEFWWNDVPQGNWWWYPPTCDGCGEVMSYNLCLKFLHPHRTEGEVIQRVAHHNCSFKGKTPGSGGRTTSDLQGLKNYGFTLRPI